MKHQETKYRVDSFSHIQKLLEAAGAKKGEQNITIHYYAEQKSNDVIKLVKYVDRNEIHILKESLGKYSLQDNIPVENTGAGLQWLKDKGFKTVNIVKMVYTDYDYKNGIVGLYKINDFLFSVILDFPKGQQHAIEKEFGLNSRQIIIIPYDKLLHQLGRARSINI